MMIAARNAFLMSGAGPSLPYDAEVEYLESTGTQWIDTGVYPDNNNGVKVSFSVSFTPAIGSEGREVFGARSSNKYFELLLDVSTYLYYQYGSSVPRVMQAVGNLDHYYDWYADKNILHDEKSGTVIATLPSQVFGITNSIYLFGLNNSGPKRLLIGRIKCCKIYSGSTLVRDFVSVRVGGGASAAGYLYDRANPTGGPLGNGLYPNAGTGAFVIGPDK